MKKILPYVASFVVIVALVNFLFNLGEYDFFAQLEKLSKLDFYSTIDDFMLLIKRISSIKEWGSLDIVWYEYIVKFLWWLSDIVFLPIVLLKDIAINLYKGLLAILTILGFNVI